MFGVKGLISRAAVAARGFRDTQHCTSHVFSQHILRSYSTKPDLGPRESDEVDLCIVGGGPAGIAAAIRFKQLDNEQGGERRVVLLEKGGEIGAHTLSGAVIEPRALDELIPDWRENMPDLMTAVTSGAMKFLTHRFALPVPEPPQMHNHGNYIVSLSNVVKWLGEKAEELGVEIYPGFSVSELVYNEDGSVKGIATKDQGIGKDGQPKESFTRGMEFHAPLTLLAEGCRGSLSELVMKKYDLRRDCDPQTYGIGIKEVWEVKPENFKKGFASHTMGWPLTSDVYGGGFQYHFGENLVALGLVVGLDYSNPYLSPYKEFQKMKTHPYYANVLEGGECLSYGARALNEGGLQSIPKLTFPGGGIIGCSAGFLNVPKVKGTHTAMKSGMLAAEAAFQSIAGTGDFSDYEKTLKDSWVWQELHEIRNVRPSFTSPLKLWGGMVYSGLDTLILKGRTPWTFHHHKTDAQLTDSASKHKPIMYEKPDNKLTFDLLTSVARTGTYHDENEPSHLRVPHQDLAAHCEKSWPKYQGIEQNFCPAGVYEYIEGADGNMEFKINSQNCIHCKTCDIKTPTCDIVWQVPEGGDGPKYVNT